MVCTERPCVFLQEFKSEHRPRLCNIKKGSTGYGFNLHSEKAKPGQYIRAVDPDSPAERASLRAQDRIVEVLTAQLGRSDFVSLQKFIL